MNDLHFEFASTGGGDATGVNDPVTTTFAGNLSYHLARESIQNIIDAKDQNVEGPAKAEFSFFEVKSSEIPGLDELGEYLKKCRDTYVSSKEDRSFYEAAITKIKNNKLIPILKISDSNTVGLTGEYNDKEGNYFSLMRAVGSSAKSGNSGGSFGLGKGAYFAASTFRTIYVSSMYDNSKVIFQGKARLASFEQNGELMQGNGSYGLKGQVPVTKKGLIPHGFLRDKNGTDIFIVGYPDEMWKDHMLKSVLNNFWLSIFKGIIDVKIDTLSITKDTIETLLNTVYSEESKETRDKENPLYYFNAYTHPSNEFKDTLLTLGDIKLSVLVKDGYPNKIMFSRKTGMVIQKKSKGAIKDFAAVFTCDNEMGNYILRKMENPAHNEWRKENVDVKYPQLIENAKYAERELNAFINKCITEVQKQDGASRTAVGGLEEFLFLPGDEENETSHSPTGQLSDNTSHQETGTEMETQEKKIQTNPIIKPVKVKHREIVEGELGNQLPIVSTGSGGKEEGEGGIPFVGGDLDLYNPVAISFRAFAIKKDEKTQHIIVVKCTGKKTINLSVKAGTEDSLVPLHIYNATNKNGTALKFENDKVLDVNTDENGKSELVLEFADEQKYSLNILAYENK